MGKIRVGWLKRNQKRRRKTINFSCHIGKFSRFIPFVIGGGGGEGRRSLYWGRREEEEGYILSKEKGKDRKQEGTGTSFWEKLDVMLSWDVVFLLEKEKEQVCMYIWRKE